MKTGELKRLLSEAGCYCVREGKEHEKWYSPITGKTFRVARHKAKEVPTGTADRILKDAGLK